MKLIKKILLATDFGPASEAARQSVVPLAKHFQADVILVHAIRHLPDVPAVYVRMSHKIHAALGEWRQWLRNQGISSTHEPIAHVGKPSEVILSAARRNHADLIVIGAGNKSLRDRILVGSSAEKIMSRATMPVWTVMPGGNAGGLRHILCAVDYSDAGRHALQNAVFLARAFNAKVTALHVALEQAFYPYFPDMPYPVTDIGMLGYAQRSLPHKPAGDAKEAPVKPAVFDTAAAEKQLREFVNAVDAHGVKIDCLVRRGLPAQGILDAAAETKADLLVMGSAGRSGMARFALGNTAERVVRHAPCSLLTIKTRDLTAMPLDNVTDLELQYELGRNLAAAGMTDAAVQRFDLCIKKDPHFAEAYEGIADVHESLGKFDVAQVWHERGQKEREWHWKEQSKRFLPSKIDPEC